MRLFLILAGGVAVGETLAGIAMSIIAARLNKRNRATAMNLAGSFAALHKSERKGK